VKRGAVISFGFVPPILGTPVPGWNRHTFLPRCSSGWVSWYWVELKRKDYLQSGTPRELETLYKLELKDAWAIYKRGVWEGKKKLIAAASLLDRCCSAATI